MLKKAIAEIERVSAELRFEQATCEISNKRLTTRKSKPQQSMWE
jgi:hypothetical protein